MDPVNIQGLHNLCVVYVERGRLLQAQSCLKHAHELAPAEDYIVRHLNIVQTRIAKYRQQQQQQLQMQQQQRQQHYEQQHQYQQYQPPNEPSATDNNEEGSQQQNHHQNHQSPHHQQPHQYHHHHHPNGGDGEWQQMRSLEAAEEEQAAAATAHPLLAEETGNGGVNGRQKEGEWSVMASSPEAQSRGNNNKGDNGGGGHLMRKSSSSPVPVHSHETYDANGHNMAATQPRQPKANHSSTAGPVTHLPSASLSSSSSSSSAASASASVNGGDELSRDQANPLSQRHGQSQHQASSSGSGSASSSVHDDVNQKLEFTFANFDPRDFSGGAGGAADHRLYLADDDHYSHEIKKNNALNQKFNNHHNYYGNSHATAQQQQQQAKHYAGYEAVAGVVGDEDEVDHRLVMGFADGSAHSVSGMIAGSSRSVLIDKDLINDGKKPKPLAIGDSKFPPVNSKG